MSLQVWLPLNGDLHNQGLSKTTITNHGATVNSAGKIGQCYYFDGTDDYIETTYSTAIGTNDFSIAMWLKIPTLTSGSYFAICSSKGGSAASSGFGIYWNYSQKKFLWSTADGSSATEIWMANTVDTIVYDKWIYLVMVRNNSDSKKGYFYINGVRYELTSVPVIRNITTDTKLFIGRCSTTTNYPAKMYLNDFRIYDHALSDKEIKELSKGLVLHYQLNQGNKNLLSNYVTPGQNAPGSTTTAGRTNYYGNYGIIIPAVENADTYFRLFLKQQLVQGQTYTISCYVSGLLSGSYYNFPLFAQGNTSMGVLQLNHNGLCYLTFTMNSSSQPTVTTPEGITVYICFMDDSARALASGQGAIIINGFKLEEGNSCTNYNLLENNLIYDCSGYNHNGSLNGNLTSVISNPKYNNTILFNNNTITLSSIFTDDINQCHTVSAWVYPTGTNDAVLINFNNGYKLYHGNGGRSLMYLNAGTYDSYVYGTVIPTNTWTFITWVLDTKSYICKVYYNGVLNANSSNYSGSDIPSGINKNLTIGSGIFGYITDIRIYATALSANDILELYKQSKIINNGNILPRSLN